MCASFRARVSLSGGETVPWPRWRNAPGRPSTTPHPVTAVPGSIPRTRTLSRILSPPLIPSAPTRNAPALRRSSARLRPAECRRLPRRSARRRGPRAPRGASKSARPPGRGASPCSAAPSRPPRTRRGSPPCRAPFSRPRASPARRSPRRRRRRHRCRRATLERDVEHALLGGGAVLDRDQPLLGEHPGDAAARPQVAVVLLEDVADLGDRPVTVVGQDRDHDRDPGGAVALVVDLLVVDALELARPLLDRALDVVARHARGLRRRDGGAQAGIGVDVTAPHARGDGDLLDHLGEDLAALGVLGRLLVLDRAPLRVAGHEFPFPIRVVGRRALSRSAGTIAESRERRSRLDGYPVCYHSAAPQVNAAGAAVLSVFGPEIRAHRRRRRCHYRAAG